MQIMLTCTFHFFTFQCNPATYRHKGLHEFSLKRRSLLPIALYKKAYQYSTLSHNFKDVHKNCPLRYKLHITNGTKAEDTMDIDLHFVDTAFS